MDERRAEVIAYAVAAVVLVVGGMVFTSAVLNWLVGPAVVVLAVAIVPPLLRRGRLP